MADYVVSDTGLSAIADAIRAKTGDTASISYYSGFVDAIGSITGGGATVIPQSDVNFYDYDGTVIASYTAAEFASLSAMPDNPSHDGLTAQGWNWALSDAKAYVAAYGKLEIGQMYITDDGKTRIYIHLEERLSLTLGLGVNGTVDVDWGDGTSHSTITGTSIDTKKTASHTYSAAGDYVIKLSVTGSMKFFGQYSDTYLFDAYMRGIVGKIEIGSGVTVIGVNAFYQCTGLAHISLPSGIIEIQNYAFGYTPRIEAVIVPNTVTTIGKSVWYDSRLKRISIPKSVTSIDKQAFYSSVVLERITLPSTLTSIPEHFRYYGYSAKTIVVLADGITSIDSNAFAYCFGLEKVVIPSTVTSIGAGAFSVTGLVEIHFKPTTPPTIANSSAFSSLPTDCKIYVPSGKLSAYTSASNYPSSSTYTYIEE